jgi:isoleucyl-tRNA synthetase
MHDWLISKPNRYWGLALPIYECKKCGHFTVIGSKEELKEKAVSGWEVFEGHSPHKPFIDAVKIKCEKCGEVVSRLNDVGNVWLDAGIVGFSTLHYMTDKQYWKEWYPADFITESFPGQFKNWFYSMIAMSTVLEKKTCFKTVLGYGSMLGEDGRPMHKSWGNSIEFNEGADKIGADVMRWMFVTHDPEQNLLFGYKKADETRRQFHLLLWNVYNFFITYATIDGWTPDAENTSTNVLDEWILSRLAGVNKIVTESLQKFDAFTAATTLQLFVADLSQWYVRRSRDRVGPSVAVGEDKDACYATLYQVLITLNILLAPFIPFITDEMYTNLTSEESVHLADWPDAENVDAQLEKDMADGRMVSSVLLAFRKQANVKVRIPFKKLSYRGPRKLGDVITKIVLAEANVYELVYDGKNNDSDEYYVAGGQSDIGNQDVVAGIARGLIRDIQMMRKEKGCTIDAHIMLTLPKDKQDLSKELLAFIQKETLADSLTWGDALTISTG